MTQTITKLQLGRPKLQLKAKVRIPATVTVTSPILLSTAGGIYAFTLDINALIAAIAPSFVAPRSQRIVTAAGAIAVLPTDDIIIVKKAAGAATTVNVDWSTRNRSLTIVDGKGDAAANPITITPAAGQTQLAIVNYSYVIDGNGASITLTPLADRSGAY